MDLNSSSLYVGSQSITIHPNFTWWSRTASCTVEANVMGTMMMSKCCSPFIIRSVLVRRRSEAADCNRVDRCGVWNTTRCNSSELVAPLILCHHSSNCVNGYTSTLRFSLCLQNAPGAGNGQTWTLRYQLRGWACLRNGQPLTDSQYMAPQFCSQPQWSHASFLLARHITFYPPSFTQLLHSFHHYTLQCLHSHLLCAIPVQGKPS